MNIKISYDGKVGVTSSSVWLGNQTISEILKEALHLGDNEYREINADVEIFIGCKPSSPRVLVEEDDEC